MSEDLVAAFAERVQQLIGSAAADQRAGLDRAAALIAPRLANGGCLHLFGTGHSHMIAEEIFYRAGGLIPVQAMLDPSVVLSGGALRSTATERTSGAAAEIAARYDLGSGDAGVVISNSGRNPAPVEMALLMRARGMPVVAITSLAHSRALPALHPPGQRLFEVADVVLDNAGAYGDAALSLPGVLYPVGPTSTILGAVIVQLLVLATMQHLVAMGREVVNLPSGNVPDGDRRAVIAELEKYRERIRHW